MAVNNDVSCLEIVSKYDYPGTGGCSLEDILNNVHNQLVEAQFSQSSLKQKDRVLNRLRNCAAKLNINEYTAELRQMFLDDTHYERAAFGSEFSKNRYELHRKVIHWVDSYIATGKVDYSPIRKRAVFLKSTKPAYINIYNTYVASIGHLAKSTKDLYCALVGYFLDYLDLAKGYTSIDQLQKGDVDAFIRQVAKEHFPNSLPSVIPGLRAFLGMEEFSLDPSFGYEIPSKLRKHHFILKPLSTDEVNQVNDFLDTDDKEISLRDRAIVEIAMGTGNRSVDITGLTFSDLDLENDRLHFVQQKTGKAHDYPLTASMGNAIVDYILHERPQSQSQYIFLTNQAPYAPLKSHSACRLIIKHILEAAEIELGDRQVGTRLTRHSRATYLLNSGVPLPIIAQSIGHKGMGTVQVYLTADEENMAECILPLPGKKEDTHE